jgi:hypothetical protein
VRPGRDPVGRRRGGTPLPYHPPPPPPPSPPLPSPLPSRMVAAARQRSGGGGGCGCGCGSLAAVAVATLLHAAATQRQHCGGAAAARGHDSRAVAAMRLEHLQNPISVTGAFIGDPCAPRSPALVRHRLGPQDGSESADPAGARAGPSRLLARRDVRIRLMRPSSVAPPSGRPACQCGIARGRPGR